ARRPPDPERPWERAEVLAEAVRGGGYTTANAIARRLRRQWTPALDDLLAALAREGALRRSGSYFCLPEPPAATVLNAEEYDAQDQDDGPDEDEPGPSEHQELAERIRSARAARAAAGPPNF